MGVKIMDSLSFGIMGPNADTPAKPAKKARVVHIRAFFGLDTA
jgi:hypothetical protein